jgi:hypothetical protein
VAEKWYSPDNNVVDKIISFIEQSASVVAKEVPRAVTKVYFIFICLFVFFYVIVRSCMTLSKITGLS